MRKFVLIALSLGVLVLSALAIKSFKLDSAKTGEPLTFEYLTDTNLIDKVYPSMFGPTNDDFDVHLIEGEPELLWVTGYGATMVGDDPSKKESQEFMCHNTLSFARDLGERKRIFDLAYLRERRLFTLSQGQDSIDFPPGFGIPVSSAEPLMLQSQVLNLKEERIGKKVRHKVGTRYLRDSEAPQKMKALTLIGGGIGLDILDPQAGEAPENPMSCALDAGGQPTFSAQGKPMTAHWVINPGKETRETVLGHIFQFDTTAHYISAHMHSYAESLELVDMTDNKTIFKANCKATADGAGLAEIDHFSSVEGVKVYRQHRYKLISKYNNTSDKDHTAMAFIFIYVHDRSFSKPSSEELKKRSEALYPKVKQPVPPKH